MKRCAAFLTLMLFGAGCATTGRSPEPEFTPVPPPPPQAVFVPAATQASLQFAAGRYPNLFAPESRAVWGGGTVTTQVSSIEPVEENAAAAAGPIEITPPAASDGQLMIECRIESEFPDISIAYDVAGLRGCNAYLELPDGTRLLPAQKIIGRELSETPVGALRRYARTNRLYFPVSDNGLLVPMGSPGLRLVIQGHDSTFFFEWPNVPPPPDYKPPIGQREGTQKLKRGWHKTTSRAKRVGGNFH
jgi:hypothetical protein